MYEKLIDDFSNQTWQMKSALILFATGKFLTIATAVMLWSFPRTAAALLAVDGVCIAFCIAFCIHNMLESFFDFTEEILLSNSIY